MSEELGVEDVLIKFRKICLDARDELQITHDVAATAEKIVKGHEDALAAINRIRAQDKIDQTMEVFEELSLSLNIDESELINARLRLIAELEHKQQLKEQS